MAKQNRIPVWPANSGDIPINIMSNRHLTCAISKLKRTIDETKFYRSHLARVGTRRARIELNQQTSVDDRVAWYDILTGEMNRREQRRIFISDDDAEDLMRDWRLSQARKSSRRVDEYDPFADE